MEKKKIVFRFLCIMLLGLMSTSVFAQGGYTVKGTVSDDMGPLVGVNVAEKGTSNGTSTDLDGNFTLKVADANSIIEISYIGYSPVSFKASQVPSHIVLSEDSELLEDVVVIGYGTVKKEDLTGSVAAVKADQLNKGIVSSPTDLLKGKSAGVVLTSGDGAPGSSSTIRIRGGSSLKASNDPLIVIDGLPVSNDGIDGTSSALSSINPSDIESFTVLKDASATAIYGSRASNGVIMITTKKGSKFDGGTPHVDVDFTSSLSQNTKYVDVLSANELRSLVEKLYGTESAAYGLLTDANTNWQKEIYQLAQTYEANASVRGKVGDKHNYMPYRVSLGYLDQQGTLRTSKMARETFSANLTPTLLDEHLTINLNSKLMNMDTRFANNDAISAAKSYDPTKPVYDENGLNGYSWWNYGKGTPTIDNCNTMSNQNPVALLNDKKDLSNAKRFIGNAQFDYKIHGFEDLRLNLNLGIDHTSSKGTVDVAPGTEQTLHNTKESGSGYHRNYSQQRTDKTLEMYADYSHDFGKSFFDIMGGYSWQHFYKESFSESFKADGTPETALDYYLNNPRTSKTEYYLVSFFGRANYSYDNRYMITATLRRDGTSRFQNNKWGLFPSVALGWNIKNESFLKDNDALSTLKLRLSYGQTGQQDLQSGDYPTLSTYTYNTNQSMYFFGDRIVTPLRPDGYNADLKWETTTTYNVGIDYGVAGGRIYGTIDAYKRHTKDLLNYTPVAAGANLFNYLDANIGDLENQGVELEVNVIPVETPDLTWTAGFNVAYNKTVITRLTTDDEREDYYGVPTGENIAGGVGNKIQIHQTGQAPSSFFVYQQVYDLEGKPIEGMYVDKNKDGIINDADKYCYKKAAPDFTYGFNTTLNYKNWTLAASAHASTGNYLYNNISSNGDLLTDLATNGFVNNRYRTAEEHNFANFAQYWSDMYIQNASFLKLDNITLSYLFNLKGHHRLSVFGTVQNVCTITAYQGIDPEIFSGIDNNMYPRPRIYMLGLKYNF